MSGYGKILLVEDDTQLALVLKDTLLDAGYDCTHEADGERGLQRGLHESFDLAILDVNLPTINGLDICRELKRGKPEIPVMMLSARTEETDIISGLEIGADEYLSKPISPKVLIARVRARLRETQRLKRIREGTQPPDSLSGEEHSLEIGNLRIDLLGSRVFALGQEIELTATEYSFLSFLASHPGRAFGREELLQAVWGTENHNYWPNVTVLVSRLRSKLEHDPLADRYLVTVRGRGYRFARSEELA